MIHKLFVAFLPVMMVMFEILMRFATGVSGNEFVGPAFAGAAASMMAPHTKIDAQQTVTDSGETVLVFLPVEEKFVHIALALLLFLVLLWLTSITLAAKNLYPSADGTKTAASTFFGLEGHLWLGVVAYLLCLVFLFAKEKVSQ